MKLIIPVHSFVDVITNSSSEIFVSAEDKTVKAVKDIIDNILASQGIDKKSDDLFKVTLEYYARCEATDYSYESFKTEAERTKFLEESGDDDSYSEYSAKWQKLVIVPLDKSDKHLKKVAEIFSTFNDQYEIWEQSN